MDIEKVKGSLNSKKEMDLVIVSGSMLPVLQVGAHYKMQKIPKNYIPKRYEIFVYWNGKILIAHYFWQQFTDTFTDNQKYWVFKSLASYQEDFPVKRENIIGKIAVQIPWQIRTKVMIRSIFNNLLNRKFT